ncbi:MAG TPA: hypothetical protein VK425_08220, partial [Acidimicrobiales bacterium]|nr:hypothetical protein [Acidimicrobiales bacterium]
AVVLSPAASGPQQRVSSTVDLSAGQSHAVTLPGLALKLSTISTLTVTAGEPGLAVDTQQLRVVAPGPNFSGVPTTSTLPTASTAREGTTTSTTAAGGGAGVQGTTSSSTPTSSTASTATSLAGSTTNASAGATTSSSLAPPGPSTT